MGRTKTKLRYIVNDTDRRTTLKKRRKGIIKKARELSILCGVPACAIIYEPESLEPMFWPSNPREAIRILQDFRSLPEMAQRRKMLNQEEFIYKRKEKLQEQIRRQMRESHEFELNIRVNRGLAGNNLNHLRIEEARGIDHVIHMRQKALEVRMRKVREAEIATTITERAKDKEKGKAPMYSNVSKQDQIAPQNFSFTDAFVREWLENELSQKVVTLSETEKGKAPMYQAMPQNYSLIDAAEQQMAPPMYQPSVLPQQTYSLMDAAEQEWIGKEKQQRGMNFNYGRETLPPQQTYSLVNAAEQERQMAIATVLPQQTYEGERAKVPMDPALAQQKYWSFDLPAINDQMTFQNNMGLEEAIQQYLDAGTPWADSDTFTF